MYRTAARLAREYPGEAAWVTIKGLFRQYRHTDAATRIAIVRRAEELLTPYWSKIKLDSPIPSDIESDQSDNAADSVSSIDNHDDAESLTERRYDGNAGKGSVARTDAITSVQPASRKLTLGLEAARRAMAAEGGRSASHQVGTGAGIAAGPRARPADTGSSRTDSGDNYSSTRPGSSPAIRGTAIPGTRGPSSAGSGGLAGSTVDQKSAARGRSPDNPTPATGVQRSSDPRAAASGGQRSSGGSSGSAGAKNGESGTNSVKGGEKPGKGTEGSSIKTGSSGGASVSSGGSTPAGKVGQSGKPIKPGAAGRGIEDTPVQFVKGVGPKMSAVLGKLEIQTVADLMRHYPRRHLDFQNRQLIRDLREHQEVSIFGSIKSVNAFQSKNRNMSVLNVVITDGTGSIIISRFVGGKSNKYLLDRYKQQFPKDAQVLASGVVERDNYSGKFRLKNAEVELLGMLPDGDEPMSESIHAGRLVPVYPLTEGVSLRFLRNVIHNALESYGAELKDPLPESVRRELELVGLREAVSTIHFPDTVEDKDCARRRLVFDELFAIQLQLAHRRYKFEQNESALSLPYTEDGLVRKLIDSLPFKLTGAQQRVFNEIGRDLQSSKPMHRLVQGDVGSGKTVVALLACMIAIENGYQAAMMAPTEILAEQHFRQFQRLLTPLGLSCTLVLGKHGAKQRREIRQGILSGQAHIAVGTHALLEDDVEFQNLGLIVIDEQHRFGVKQRARLKAKSLSPELLTMTATPIPRTLAMTMHGDLDVSEIDELPPGRKRIETKLVRPSAKEEMWDFIQSEVAKGRQIYIVFPLIDESESLSAKAATIEFEKLQLRFKNLRFGLMHGKLKPQEKDEVMEQFRDGIYNVLISTTVIEVGVDVPNATIMLIENADRFGLAQLHQLRGRVGRGSEQSYCFLISDSKSQGTRERLEILTQTNDGFVVAEKDLEIRGPGEFLGYKQSGMPDLILADLVQDARTLEEARNMAISLIKVDPELQNHKGLREILDKRLKSATVDIVRSG